jgi:hypothetical protein
MPRASPYRCCQFQSVSVGFNEKTSGIRLHDEHVVNATKREYRSTPSLSK